MQDYMYSSVLLYAGGDSYKWMQYSASSLYAVWQGTYYSPSHAYELC